MPGTPLSLKRMCNGGKVAIIFGIRSHLCDPNAPNTIIQRVLTPIAVLK